MSLPFATSWNPEQRWNITLEFERQDGFIWTEDETADAAFSSRERLERAIERAWAVGSYDDDENSWLSGVRVEPAR